MDSKRTQEELEGTAGEFVERSVCREETAEQSRWSQSLYEKLARTAPVSIFQTDMKGECIDINERWCEIADISPTEARRTAWVKGLHREDEDMGKVNGYVGTRTDITAANENEEALRQCRDHPPGLPKERTVTLTESHQSVFKEITERKRMGSALGENEARYRAIVEDQTELICRFLPGGIITFVNDAYCRYFSKKREELIGHTFLPFIPHEDRERVEKHFASLSPRNPVGTHEHRVFTPAGDIRWLQWTDRVILDDYNRPVEFQTVGRDITERKAMEQELKRTSKEIKLFAYSVAHDLKSPANALEGLTRLFEKRYGDACDDKAKEYCRHILRAAEQIDALAQKINIYISTKETSLRVEEVSLKDICKMIEAEFSPQLRSRKIDWIEPVNCPSIPADRLSVVRALTNLVDNALKYGGHGLSEIRIGYEESERFHLLSVRDNGVGVEKEEAERIFGLFQRLKTDQAVSGAGLGLAIVKEIAEQHGGKAWVESNPNEGARFYVAISKHLEAIRGPVSGGLIQ